MIEELGEALYSRYFNPCKKCLVQATCEPSSTKCDKYDHFHKQNHKISSIGSDIEAVVLILYLCIGVLFIISIFVFGIWKWIEIIF
jgi:hypothetical protein